ncbi:MAG: BrnA antitoxin family protein [Proteobacteria bacterium]|nr:BrnA antitoxin family protein [Pseudomonadota bacterium]
MSKKHAKSAAASGSRARAWHDPDDAPEITDAMLDRATIVKGGKVIQRGRPPLGDNAKQPVTVRLDADIVASYRALGRGWQTQMNADLRRARKLKKAG